MSDDALEITYRRLLRAYPKGYRRTRGAEIIGTLMEAAGPGQRRPTAREATALVLRGLQARAGANLPGSAGRAWFGALRLAALLLLAYATAGGLAETGRVIPHVLTLGLDYPPELIYPLGTVIAALALIAVAAGRYVLGLLATLGALAASLAALYLGMVAIDYFSDERFYPPLDFVWARAVTDPTLWPLPLAALLVAPLIRWRAPGTRRSWAWLLAVPVAAVLLPTDYAITTGLQPEAPVLVMVGFLLWAAVDARATLAAGVLILPVIISLLAIYAQGGVGAPEITGSAWFWIYTAGVLVLLAAGALGLRRQARV